MYYLPGNHCVNAYLSLLKMWCEQSQTTPGENGASTFWCQWRHQTATILTFPRLPQVMNVLCFVKRTLDQVIISDNHWSTRRHHVGVVVSCWEQGVTGCIKRMRQRNQMTCGHRELGHLFYAINYSQQQTAKLFLLAIECRIVCSLVVTPVFTIMYQMTSFCHA